MSDVSDLSDDDLFGELRRRRPSDITIREQLGIEIHAYGPMDYSDRLRMYALFALATMTTLLICLVGFLAYDGSDIPDLVSGLTGSGIGAIAGLLSSSGNSASRG